MLALSELSDGRPIKGETLATVQQIPVKFLENILLDLRRSGLISSQRGAEGGYRLSRPAEDITLADVIRAVDGPLANIRGIRPGSRCLRGSRRPASGTCGSPCGRRCGPYSRSRVPGEPTLVNRHPGAGRAGTPRRRRRLGASASFCWSIRAWSYRELGLTRATGLASLFWIVPAERRAVPSAPAVVQKCVGRAAASASIPSRSSRNGTSTHRCSPANPGWC